MKWLFFDFETLGKDPMNCVVVDVAFVALDYKEILDSSYKEIFSKIQKCKFDIKEQKELGWIIDRETVSFWKSQPPEIQKSILPSKDDILLMDFGDMFLEYIDKNSIDLWWSRGNNFDPVILHRIFSHLGVELNKRLKYYNVRDIRTYIHTRFDFSSMDIRFDPFEGKLSLEGHDSRNDVLFEILRMQKIERILNETK